MILFKDLQEAFNQIDIYFDDEIEFSDLTKEENQVLSLMNKIENLSAEMRCDFNFIGLTVKKDPNFWHRYSEGIKDSKHKDKFYFLFQEEKFNGDGWVC